MALLAIFEDTEMSANPRIYFSAGKWRVMRIGNKPINSVNFKKAHSFVAELKRKSFTNESIVEKTYGKPHIVLINGYWRVSKRKPKTGNRYEMAHYFVVSLNAR